MPEANVEHFLTVPTEPFEEAFDSLYASGMLTELIDPASYRPTSSPVPLLPAIDRPRPRLGSLYWPVVGAANYAYTYLIVDEYTMGRMRAEMTAHSTGSYNVRLYDDPTDTAETPRTVSGMLFVCSRPIVRTTSGALTTDDNGTAPVDAWLVLLTDARYLYLGNTVTYSAAGNVFDTRVGAWNTLIESLSAIAFNVVLAFATDTVDADYSTPSDRWSFASVGGQNAAWLLDSALAAVGMRMVFNPTAGAGDFFAEYQGPTGANKTRLTDAHATYAADGRHLGGGLLTADDIDPGLPQFIQGVFGATGSGPTGEYLATGKGFYGLPTSWMDMKATASSGDRTAAATQWVADWVAWQSSPLDCVYSGFVPGVRSGFVWAVEYHHSAESGTTRFMRAPPWYGLLQNPSPKTGDALTTGTLAQFAATTSLQLKGVISDETGSGALVFATNATLVNPALGTPASGTLTNCAGLPIGTGVSGLAAGASAFLATATSANLATLVSDETGSGSLVFATSPTLVTPNLGTPSAAVLTNATGTASGLTAGTATALATARTINGVSFDGTANITVTAAAGTLTGTTLAAGVVTSSLTGLGTITSGVWNGTALTASYVPALNAITAPTGDVSINSHKLTNVTDPTAAQDAATKAYVDTAVAAVETKQECTSATTTALAAATYANGSSGVGATLTLTVAAVLIVDGYTPVLNDRILIKNQASALQNGVYTLTTVGVAGLVQAVLTRSTDFDQNADGIDGALVYVLNGTTNANTLWVCTTTGAVTVGTTGINWTQFTGSTYTADETTVHLSGTTFSIKSTYVGQTSIVTLGTITTGVWTGTAVAVANGGTGSGTAAGARTNLGATTVGANLFTLTNPSAITFPRINADNTVDALSASSFRTAIGAGTGSGTVTSVASADASVTVTSGTTAADLALNPTWLQGRALINGYIVTSVSGNAMTVAIKNAAGNDPSASGPVKVVFPGVAGAAPTTISLTAATSFVVSNGSTLGTVAGTGYRVWFVAFNDAGTLRLGAIVTVANTTEICLLRDGYTASSTAEGGAGAADSSQTFYTGTAVTTKQYRVLGYGTWSSGLATAGVWTSNANDNVQFGPGVPLPGDVIHSDRTDYGAVATGTTQIPHDNTTPLVTEGDQYMSRAATWASAANIARVRAQAHLTNDGGASNMVAALFTDGVSGCLKSAWTTTPAASFVVEVRIDHSAKCNGASETFTVRCGSGTAGTTTFNGTGGAAKYNGTLNSFIAVEEVMT